MSNKEKNQKFENRNEDLRIEWFGVDGLLCLIYVIEAVLFAWAMINNNDFIIGVLIPYGVAAVTTAVFVKYFYQVISFSRKNKQSKS